jgi:glutamine synthetase
MWFGIEQEYTFFDGAKPLGWPDHGFPAPQGIYYCGVGADEVFGRPIVEQHMQALTDAGIKLAGVNAEMMPAQWEFQIGPVPAPAIGDQLGVARWLLHRVAEMHSRTDGRSVSVRLDPKPVDGDWNGAGAHTNFSTKHMRASYEACLDAIQALQDKHDHHIRHYGYGIERRLTGCHETARYDAFTSGVSNRGASIRIPWHVARNQQGYLEDRRPNANCDPYVVSRLIMETVCGAANGCPSV